MNDPINKTTEELVDSITAAVRGRHTGEADAEEFIRRNRNLLTLATNAVNAGGLQVSDRRNELRQFIEGTLVTGPGRCEHCGLFLLRDGSIASCPVHGGDYRG